MAVQTEMQKSMTDGVALLKTKMTDVTRGFATGVVDGQDLALVLAHWGSSNPDVDLNLDGIVNGADMTLLLASWE